jgi:Domain of unknown function (DUF4492)
MTRVRTFLRKFVSLYTDGFRDLPRWGRKIWVILLLKLFIIFAVLKLFFFPDFLQKRFSNDTERSRYVLEQLTNPINKE